MTGSDTTNANGFASGDDNLAECPRCGLVFKPVKIQVLRADTESRGVDYDILEYRQKGHRTIYGVTKNDHCSDCMQELYLENTFDIYGNCQKCGQFCCEHTGGCGRCDKCL